MKNIDGRRARGCYVSATANRATVYYNQVGDLSHVIVQPGMGTLRVEGHNISAAWSSLVWSETIDLNQHPELSTVYDHATASWNIGELVDLASGLSFADNKNPVAV
jgi:hypothetical protein